jgi:hypothetical protein
MRYIYFYLVIGIIVTVVSYISYYRKEKDISEVVHDKLHGLRNDDSFSFQSANILGHLLAFVFSAAFWPTLIIKKILGY